MNQGTVNQPTMNRQIRIIDIGQGAKADAKSESPEHRVTATEMQAGFDIELWQSFISQAVPAGRDAPFYPPAGESLLRFFVLPPAPSSAEVVDWNAISDGFFASNEIEDCRVDGAPHPLMHKTPTSDCVILLEGSVQLVLEHGAPIEIRPFDVVRQTGTPHAWVNVGSGPAVLVALMHGS